MGASPRQSGASGVQSHMTNTLNTPIEAMEFEFPLRMHRYSIRKDSGGNGQNKGGDGLIREMEFLVPAHLTILSERRKNPPYGLQGGLPGTPGANLLKRPTEGDEIPLPAKTSIGVKSGDILSVQTPGGGGHGKKNR